MNWFWFSKIYYSKNFAPIAGLLGVSASIAFILYVYRRKNYLNKVSTAYSSCLKLEIPEQFVGIIIGRKGRTIKNIQSESETNITFQTNDKKTYCLIRGYCENTYLAQSIILNLIANQPNVFEEKLTVPQSVCGKIIGKNGATVKYISKLSNAKIFIDSSNQIGTSEEISYAKKLINELVEEKNSCSDQVIPFFERIVLGNIKLPSQASLKSLENSVDVYVSTINTPYQFWVQLIEDSMKLKELVENMTTYYASNLETNRISHVKKDMLVAAPFYDNKWYRAQVYKEMDKKWILFYVDYGDISYLHSKHLRDLNKEYLQLPFQAIECCLDNTNLKNNEWSKNAIDKFEELVEPSMEKAFSLKVLRFGTDEVAVVELTDKENVNISTKLQMYSF